MAEDDSFFTLGIFLGYYRNGSRLFPSRSIVFVTVDVDGGGAFQTCRTKVSVPYIGTELLCCYYCEEWQIAIMLE
jgi:hypothetical protein